MSEATSAEDVVVNDASCLIDLRKGRLLHVLVRLPCRLIVPYPVRHSELLDFTPQEWRQLDEGGMETLDLPPDAVAAAFAVRRDNPRLSVNDCLCLVATEMCNRGILLTGDGTLRRAAMKRGVRVHGVLWAVDQLSALCPADLLIGALEAWASDAAVFLPAEEIALRLARLRAG